MRAFSVTGTLAAAVMFAAAPIVSHDALRAAASLSASEILAAADRSRNGWDSFVVDVVITTYKADKAATAGGGNGLPHADEASRYQVFIKGSDKTLVKFEDVRDRGKVLLELDEAMWFYLPSTSHPIRVTALQRLSGNASNADVAQRSYAAAYTPVLAGEEVVKGQATYVLDLTAKKKGTSYQQIRYWVASETLLPVKAEFTLTSGKASKMTEFEEYRTVQGRRLLTRQVIYDLLRNEQQTVMEYRNYEGRPLPDKMFNQSFLREY
jgi:outer membrane lipoprotein-sorting protein